MCLPMKLIGSTWCPFRVFAPSPQIFLQILLKSINQPSFRLFFVNLLGVPSRLSSVMSNIEDDRREVPGANWTPPTTARPTDCRCTGSSNLVSQLFHNLSSLSTCNAPILHYLVRTSLPMSVVQTPPPRRRGLGISDAASSN